LNDIIPYPTTPLPDISPSYDVIIIGSGISGCSVAYHYSLKYPEYTILVIEKRPTPSSGASGRNGGHLQPIPYDASEFECVDAIIETGVDCDLEQCGLVRLFQKDKDFNNAINVISDLPSDLQQNFFFIRKQDLVHYAPVREGKFVGGYLNKKSCRINPVKLALGLLSRTSATLVCNAEVTSFDHDSNEVSIRGLDSCVTARVQIVDCRGCDTYPDDQHSVPTRGQIICSSPMQQVFPHSISTGVSYLVQRNDGRIVYGGMRGNGESYITDDTSINPDIAERLRSSFKNFFDIEDEFEVESEWTGIMDYRGKGKSFEANPRALYGFNGHGMPKIFSLARDRVVI
jgi:glycine/D-amino acid oxidase-like deaminating enzyme